MEGIGHHIGSISEQAQKLRRARIQDLPGLGVYPSADAAELHHRQSRLRRQTLHIGRQGAGSADAVAENVPAGGIVRRVVRHGSPLLRCQQQRGVQHFRRLSAGRVRDNGAALPLPGGKMGKAL